MKIALVTYAIQMGGVETFLLRLGTYLQKAGHEVVLVETEERGVWADAFENSGLKVVDVLPEPLRSRRRHAIRIADVLVPFDVVVLNDAPYAQSALGLLRPETVAFAIVHGDMASMYRERINDDRLRKVVEHVRTWLFPVAAVPEIP